MTFLFFNPKLKIQGKVTKASYLLKILFSFWVCNLNSILIKFNIPIMTFIFIPKPYRHSFGLQIGPINLCLYSLCFAARSLVI